MENTISQAFAEVYDIIMHLEKDLYNKIPKSFLELLEKNRDKEYKFNIDYLKDINEQYLLQDTRAILALIYRDFLCDEEQRLKLKEQDEILLEKNKKKLYEKHNTDNIFRNKANNTISNKEISLIEKKNEKWYTKVFMFIKNLVKNSKKS